MYSALAGMVRRTTRTSSVSEAWLRDAVTERLPLLLAAARALMHNDADARDLTQQTAPAPEVRRFIFTARARRFEELKQRERQFGDRRDVRVPGIRADLGEQCTQVRPVVKGAVAIGRYGARRRGTRLSRSCGL